MNRNWLIGFALISAACGGDRGEQSSAQTTITASATADGSSSSASVDTGTMKLDVLGNTEESGVNETEECAEISETSDVGLQPADIIIVVDNSGSMGFEASAVQANLNAFSSQIIVANVDARVVLISAYPTDDAGICIDQPLGSGGCPAADNNPPSFTHIDQGVGSNDGLEKIITNFPNYSDVLRPTAAKHIVIVTDDDSDLSAANFTAMFTALDPQLAEFTFHGIIAPTDPILACVAGDSCCAISAAVGDEYFDLIDQTGGIYGNLCDQEFQPIFDEISTEVIQGAVLACEYDIPPPPDGEDFDPDKVNVSFADGVGGTLDIGRVDTAAECAGVTDGWYYDDIDNPTRIIVCPQTCDKIQGFAGASIAIKFGCATIPAG